MSLTIFNIWQKEFFQNRGIAFDRKSDQSKNNFEKKALKLREKIIYKDGGITEIMEMLQNRVISIKSEKSI
jgi:hypothetical protein